MRRSVTPKPRTTSAARGTVPIPREWLPRLVRTHGSLLPEVMGGDPGRHFGAGLTEREAAWMRKQEWAMAPDDVLWRRTRLGLHLSPEEAQAFRDAWEGLTSRP